MTGQGATHRHSHAQSLLTAIALISLSALCGPHHPATRPDLGNPATGVLVTGITAGPTANGVRSHARLAVGQYKLVPLRQGGGLAVTGSLFLAARPCHAPLPTVRGNTGTTRGRAGLHQRDRAPPRRGNHR